jgi:hypothetical protein
MKKLMLVAAVLAALFAVAPAHAGYGPYNPQPILPANGNVDSDAFVLNSTITIPEGVTGCPDPDDAVAAAGNIDADAEWLAQHHCRPIAQNKPMFVVPIAEQKNRVDRTVLACVVDKEFSDKVWAWAAAQDKYNLGTFAFPAREHLLKHCQWFAKKVAR